METVEELKGLIIMKKCPHCGKELPLDAFSKNRCNPDGRQGYCKKCRSEIAKLTASSPKKAPLVLKLKDFTDDALLKELRKRGYAGELTFSKVVNI